MTEVKMKYCHHCGAQIAYEAEICPKCGVRVSTPPQTSPSATKNPGIAAVLSALFMGIGQIYNGQIAKGILMGVVAIVCIATSMFIVPLILLAALWIYGVYDAYKTAGKINRGEIRR